MASKVRKKCHYICKTNIVYGVFGVDIHFGPKTNDLFYFYNMHIFGRQVTGIRNSTKSPINLHKMGDNWQRQVWEEKKNKIQDQRAYAILLQIGRKKNLIILKRKVCLLTINTTVCYPLSTIHNNVEMKTSWGDFRNNYVC